MRQEMENWVRKNAFYLAWIVSLAGLLLSLYIGELLRIEPCHLCWYQRIALFPIVLLLGIAVYRNDLRIIPYVLPFTAIGCAIAIYQAIGIKIPYIFSSATCGLADECADPVFTVFGFVTFPLLSALGFALIGFFLLLASRKI